MSRQHTEGSPPSPVNRVTNFFKKITADETVKAFKKVGKEMGRIVDLAKETAKRPSKASAPWR